MQFRFSFALPPNQSRCKSAPYIGDTEGNEKVKS